MRWRCLFYVFQGKRLYDRVITNGRKSLVSYTFIIEERRIVVIPSKEEKIDILLAEQRTKFPVYLLVILVFLESKANVATEYQSTIMQIISFDMTCNTSECSMYISNTIYRFYVEFIDCLLYTSDAAEE